MKFFATSANATKRSADCLIVGVYDKKELSDAAAAIDSASGGILSAMLGDGDISCALGSTHLLSGLKGVKAPRVVVVGLGRRTDFDRRAYAKAMAAALTRVGSTAAKDAISYLSAEDVVGCDTYYRGRLAAQALGDHIYRFNDFKSKGKRPPARLKRLGLGGNGRASHASLELGATHGAGIATGMDLTRDLGNTPANVCHPTYLAETAKQLAEKHSKLTVKVLEEAQMRRLGMNSLLSVGHGSEQPSKLIQMDYRGGKKGDAPIVLVGKGITFDTGGISLKPGPMMDEMKYDMGGAAAVMGAMAAVVAMKLPINLMVIVPSAENMPSGRATRPGDIVKSLSGQTIEILNTDAEGRLILCDALTYSQRFKPSTVIDVATLTGACVIALGHHRSGLMTHDESLADQLMAAGERAVDRAWRLPLDQEYTDQLKSNFADYANIGGREGGAITAGAFLSQFTKGMRWAHLDIAGTAWRGGAKKGSTGRPVPLLVDFLIEQSH
ncbi:MAG: leucyl aminopeptidase [Pseudomonadota bacterium]